MYMFPNNHCPLSICYNMLYKIYSLFFRFTPIYPKIPTQLISKRQNLENITLKKIHLSRRKFEFGNNLRMCKGWKRKKKNSWDKHFVKMCHIQQKTGNILSILHVFSDLIRKARNWLTQPPPLSEKFWYWLTPSSPLVRKII